MAPPPVLPAAPLPPPPPAASSEYRHVISGRTDPCTSPSPAVTSGAGSSSGCEICCLSDTRRTCSKTHSPQPSRDAG